MRNIEHKVKTKLSSVAYILEADLAKTICVAQLRRQQVIMGNIFYRSVVPCVLSGKSFANKTIRIR